MSLKLWLWIGIPSGTIVAILLFLGISGTVEWKTLFSSVGIVLVAIPMVMIAVTILVVELWGLRTAWGFFQEEENPRVPVIGVIVAVAAVLALLGSFTTIGWLPVALVSAGLSVGTLFGIGVYALYRQFSKKEEPKQKKARA